MCGTPTTTAHRRERQPAADAQVRLLPGLTGASGTVSIQSVNFPGYHLRHSNYDFALVQNDGSATFTADEAFRRVAGLADATGRSDAIFRVSAPDGGAAKRRAAAPSSAYATMPDACRRYHAIR